MLNISQSQNTEIELKNEKIKELQQQYLIAKEKLNQLAIEQTSLKKSMQMKWKRHFSILFARLLELRLHPASQQAMKQLKWIEDDDGSEIWLNWANKLGLGGQDHQPANEQQQSIEKDVPKKKKKKKNGIHSVIAIFEKRSY